MKAVLYEPRGGLGDGLLYSTLPARLTEMGYDVFVSDKTKARNPEVYDLLYNSNPYIQGVSTEMPTAGCVHDKEFFSQARFQENPIEFIQRLHGIPPQHFPPGRRPYPRIYYEPQMREDFQTKIVLDPCSISQQYLNGVISAFVQRYAPDETVTVLASKFYTRPGIGNSAPYVVANLHEYIDIVASCRRFLTMDSGGHMVASAVREDETYCLITTAAYNDRYFVMPNVRYVVTGQMLTGDYRTSPDPVRW